MRLEIWKNLFANIQLDYLMVRVISIVAFAVLLVSCKSNKNDKEAQIVREDNKLYIKLTGKREPRASSPGNLLRDKTVNDSLLIPLPVLQNGVIKGEDIPVRKGYYAYKGEIVINGADLNVRLFFDNYDDKRLDPLSWNGNYKLKVHAVNLK
jgi:hypothetical protein